MKPGEPVYSVMIGPEVISIGDFKITDNNEFHFRKIPTMPLIDRFLPVVGANFDTVPYEERKIYVPGKGVTDETVRIYWSDLMNKKYFFKINSAAMASMDHLRAQLETLLNINNRLIKMIFDDSMDDRLKKRVSEEAKFWGKDIREMTQTFNPYSANNLMTRRIGSRINIQPPQG